MRIPLSWLREFVDVTATPEAIAHALTSAGIEVAAITYLGVAGSELPWDREKILVCNILEVMPHPNADRLVLARVDYGAAEPHVVVTGAPNLFPYRGIGPLSHPLRSVFAKEGARLYDGHVEGKVITTLKGRPVRGVMSDAMLCSEKELGISEEHDGILFLEDDAPIGTPLSDFIGEAVIEIEITPNFARCLSILGVAREVAAIFKLPLRLPEPELVATGAPIAGRAKVTIEEPALCPRFTVGLIEGVTVGDSPKWMQRRLINAGMRPINLIVDVSNYVMLELGQPTHAFDADAVRDRHLIVRSARVGERLTTLDGKDRDLTPGPQSGLSRAPLLVCDPDGPAGIAGVMGGEASEVRATSTNILFEAAIWEPVQIRKTARDLKLPSEASRRFERGVDYELPLLVQRRALELIRTYAGGTVAQGFLDEYPQPWPAPVVEITPREIARIVGITLSAAEIAELLTRLGFACTIHGGVGMGDFALLATEQTVQVVVPSYRLDVSIPADLCEEVARIYGYIRIPERRMAEEIPAPAPHPNLVLDERCRDILAGLGLNEVITHALIDMELVAAVAPSAAVASNYLKLANPNAPERSYLRRSLLPSLLAAVALNSREYERIAIFEVGRAFLPQAEPGTGGNWLPDEQRRIALALHGPRDAATWSGAHDEVFDFYDLKGVVEQLAARLQVADLLSFVPLRDDERFHPGRSARILLNRPNPEVEAGKRAKQGKGTLEVLSEPVGVIGELHPAVRERLGLSGRVVAAELELDLLYALVRDPRYQTISRFPAVLQDIAVIAPSSMAAAQIAEVVRRNGGASLESLAIFDLYSGPQIGEGKRSIAFRLAFRAPDRTLTDEDANRVRAKIVKALERELGVTIRQ